MESINSVEIKVIGNKLLICHSGLVVMLDFENGRTNLRPGAVCIAGVKIAVKPVDKPSK